MHSFVLGTLESLIAEEEVPGMDSFLSEVGERADVRVYCCPASILSFHLQLKRNCR